MQGLMFSLALFTFVPAVRDGTVIVLENSNRFVEAYTKSEITHVAILLNEKDEPWVYEATPHEVRKLRLNAYYVELADFNRGRSESSRLRVRLYQPKQPYTEGETNNLRSYLDSQLGRRYSIKGYVRNKAAPGVHCAEMVSTSLSRTGRYEFAKAYAVSPSTLVGEIAASHDAPLDVTLPCCEATGTWCERSQAWWGGVLSWCGWFCWESLTFYP